MGRNPQINKRKHTDKKKEKETKDKCKRCGFEHYASFLYCPHCSAVNRKRVPYPHDWSHN